MGLALRGLLEARPGVRSVAKPILMLDLDGRGNSDNTEPDLRQPRRKVHGEEGGIGVNDTDIICNLISVSVTCVWGTGYRCVQIPLISSAKPDPALGSISR